MKPAVYLWLVPGILLASGVSADPENERVSLHVGGRVETVPNQIGHKHQWPGVYFEGAFKGPEISLETDGSGVQYKVLIDGKLYMRLADQGHEVIRIGKLGDGTHTIRIEKISETQTYSGAFNQILVAKGRALPLPPRIRQIEFIGDSFTVGYGNTSTKRECTKDDVWATTDTSQAFGPITAKAYDADYQINAFSGRGMVRNYNGLRADTLPLLYKYVLFDGKTEYSDPNWQPELIVIGLGTNDFSTALTAGEKWTTRAALRADYRTTYVDFVTRLRADHPKAQFLLMASDQMDGEIRDQVIAVTQTLKGEGETRVDAVIFSGLDYAGCHGHPSLADHQKLSAVVKGWIDAHPDVWR
ncbi:SGNH/GDSL hydrolase family protein [Asticcacaulis sp. YBE204]|uniref:SGNH/GDSL hydrolase family protein n=1 Tax=Asticcacaulis sp. YBE204 TaxID=1282363 RepID=UPI0003C3CA52|nr:SGNH/GDSL hydrolase family protein [Asticcacaulis sp. YBE204]ESQ77930.1 hypothetical protein AEYBE204_15650 [Asticcacaulis sp. YBE204]